MAEEPRPLDRARLRIKRRARKAKNVALLRADPVAYREKRSTERKVKSDAGRKGYEALVAHRASIITLDLQMAHTLGNQSYGPGTVKVPQDVAAMLQETERRAVEVEEVFRGNRAMLVIPGARGGVRAMPVPPSMFDSALMTSAVPFSF